jgi:hypothetical protein
VNYVGIDWAYGRAAYCAMGEGGEIRSEGLIPPNEDGLARLVLRLGTEAWDGHPLDNGVVFKEKAATLTPRFANGRPIGARASERTRALHGRDPRPVV